MEKPVSRLERATILRPHTRPRPCKHCAASARRRSYRSSLFPAGNFFHERFKARVAAQRVEIRIDLDKIEVGRAAFLSCSLQPIQSLIFFSEGEMNDSDGVRLNITRRSLFGHLRQYLARFGLATHALFSMRNE